VGVSHLWHRVDSHRLGLWIGEKSIPSLLSVGWLLSPESSSGRFCSENYYSQSE
jgi:hypothetical protein